MIEEINFVRREIGFKFKNKIPKISLSANRILWKSRIFKGKNKFSENSQFFLIVRILIILDLDIVNILMLNCNKIAARSQSGLLICHGAQTFYA